MYCVITQFNVFVGKNNSLLPCFSSNQCRQHMHITVCSCRLPAFCSLATLEAVTSFLPLSTLILPPCHPWHIPWQVTWPLYWVTVWTCRHGVGCIRFDWQVYAVRLHRFSTRSLKELNNLIELCPENLIYWTIFNWKLSQTRVSITETLLNKHMNHRSHTIENRRAHVDKTYCMIDVQYGFRQYSSTQQYCGQQTEWKIKQSRVVSSIM